MELTIWHNPRCSKSRQALQLLRDRGFEPAVVEYLKNPPPVEEIVRVLALLDIEPRALMRTGEAVYRDNDLAEESDDELLIEAMFHHPILIERPVVIAGQRAVIGRPPEAVLGLLSASG